MIIRITLFILISIYGLNTNSQTKDTTAECAKFKKLRKYKYIKKRYQKKLDDFYKLIDTNAVYLTNTNIGCKFIRFFGNGIMFRSKYYNKENEIEYNNLCNGKLYVIKYNKINEFFIRIKNNDWITDSRIWSYGYYKIINKDSIVFYKEERGCNCMGESKMVYYVNFVYIKKKVPLYNYKWWEYCDPKDLRIPWKEREARKQKRKQKKN